MMTITQQLQLTLIAHLLGADGVLSAQRALFRFNCMILLGSQDYDHLHFPDLETGGPERLSSLPEIAQLAGGPWNWRQTPGCLEDSSHFKCEARRA